ncbi:MAG: ATP-binding protein [Woeseiaceae bacterium]
MASGLSSLVLLLYFVSQTMRLNLTLLLLMLSCPLIADDHVELLNDEERQWLDSLSRPLLVATEVGYHPYNFVDEQGELSGVAGDYMALLEERLEVELEVRAYATFAEVLEAAENREVDIIPLVIAAPNRKSYLNFTQPAYATRDRIFMRDDTEGTFGLEDLGGVRVGVVEGYSSQAILETEYPDIELVLVPDEIEGLLALSLGRIDAYLSEIGTSTYYINQEAITNLRVAGQLDNEDLQTMATRNDWPILNSIIGKGLASITPTERDKIQQRWINLGGVDPGELERLWKQVGTVVGIGVLLFVAMSIWSLSLRRLVAKRTLELENELEERRVVEAAKLRLAVAVEQSAEFVLVIDTSENIEYANRSFRDAYGHESVEGRALNSLTAHDADQTLAQALRTVRNTGSWRGQVELVRNPADPLKVQMIIVPISDEESGIDGYVATARDITKEELLEARIRQGERLSALGTLAGGIAHDFNNLLVPILGYADLLRSEYPDIAPSYLVGITDASERARDLVQRIMIFGRGGIGGMKPLDIRFEVKDSISFLKSLLPSTITLHEDLSECGSILGDRTQFQQLLVNLCSNASTAMAGESGTLRIKLERRIVEEHDVRKFPEIIPGEYAILTVADSGVGMTAETKARIFDPYFSTRQEDGGTGLGLAIVHGIVSNHGGVIDVDSEPGKGTTVRIYLPTVPEEASHHESSVDSDRPSGQGQLIMVVDDNELVLTTMTKLLNGLGYEASAWSDPNKAIRAFSAEPTTFDAILADFAMPGMTGAELTEQALAIRTDIPCAILTGNSSALQDSDAAIITKPVLMSELASSLHELLR